MKYTSKHDVARDIERDIIASLRREYGNEGYLEMMRDRKTRSAVSHRARALADLEFQRISGQAELVGIS